MTITDCPQCGGTHWGQHECPFIKAPCIVCGEQTLWACSDCGIDSGGKNSTHVCHKRECREKHEARHPSSSDVTYIGGYSTVKPQWWKRIDPPTSDKS